MKRISVHVEEEPYRALKALAARRGRPVAELMREAMSEYLRRRDPEAEPADAIPPYDSGRLLEGLKRSEIYDEMLAERSGA